MCQPNGRSGIVLYLLNGQQEPSFSLRHPAETNKRKELETYTFISVTEETLAWNGVTFTTSI